MIMKKSDTHNEQQSPCNTYFKHRFTFDPEGKTKFDQGKVSLNEIKASTLPSKLGDRIDKLKDLMKEMSERKSEMSKSAKQGRVGKGFMFTSPENLQKKAAESRANRIQYASPQMPT